MELLIAGGTLWSSAFALICDPIRPDVGAPPCLQQEPDPGGAIFLAQAKHLIHEKSQDIRLGSCDGLVVIQPARKYDAVIALGQFSC